MGGNNKLVCRQCKYFSTDPFPTHYF